MIRINRYSLALAVGAGFAMMPSVAVAEDSQRVWTAGNSGERPTVFVSFGVLDPLALFALNEVQLEWTANGQPMPPNLSGAAECIAASAQAYSCEALHQWLTLPAPNGGRPGRNLTLTGYPEGFQLKNMEFDTDYCFRFKMGIANWGNWSCARTQPPPARPVAPPQPLLTLLPGESGSGKIGGGRPWRILVEWKSNLSNLFLHNAKEAVWILDAGQWRPVPIAWVQESGPGERIIVMPQHYDPGAVYTFRVCAENLSGEACSPIAHTAGRPWLEQAPAGGNASRFPVPEPQGTDTYDPDTPRAIPADPVVEAHGRVRPGGAPSTVSSLSICEKARVARDRNSPAAPGLAKSCIEGGGSVPQ